MLYIPRNEICIFLFPLFHDNFIKYSVLWIWEFNVQVSSINPDTIFNDRSHHVFDDLFRQAEFRARKNLTVLFDNIVIQDWNN